VGLVESRGRRAAFLETVVAELGLRNVTVHALRLDALLAAQPGARWESVSWKAIRLERQDLEEMLKRLPRELWVFHGRRLSADEADIRQSHDLAERRSVPGRASSHLSIYRLRSELDPSVSVGSGNR
jgi:16S rRNA G527 N7-methylase RsmG